MAAIICREFGWTYQEYQNQPSWFIDIIVEMLKIEVEQMEKKVKNNS